MHENNVDGNDNDVVNTIIITIIMIMTIQIYIILNETLTDKQIIGNVLYFMDISVYISWRVMTE